MKKSIFLFFAAILCSLSAGAATERVYFVNASNWSTINVHAWDGTATGTSWPGNPATQDTWQWEGKDVYYFEAEAGAYKKCIFNNGNGQQTADLPWTANQVYDHNSQSWLPVEVAQATTTGTTVYFVNTENWNPVNVYAFSKYPSEINNSSWPGVAATKESYQIGGFDVYSYKITKEFDYCIFNNGSQQSADLPWYQGKYYAPSKNTWYDDKAAAEEALAVPVDDVTVYFINTAGWDEVACHHWLEGVSGTTWPGDVMTKETEQIAGYDVYTLTFTGEHPKCIFNNNKESGASQTGNLDVQDGKYYALSTQTWYDTKADAENALATPLPDETVYFVNNKSWTKVQVYGFEGSKGNADPAWPGTDITTNKTGEKVGEYDVYSFTAKQGEYTKIIFNNKEGDTGEQTNNLVWTNGKYYYMEAPTNYEGGTADEVKTAIDNLVTYDYYIADNGSLSGNADWSSKAIGLTDDNSDGVYEKTFTAQAAGTYLLKVTNGTWNDGYVWGFSAVEGAYEEVNAGESDNNIEITLTTATTFTVKFDSDTKKITFDGLTEKAPEPTFDYYIAGSFNGDNPKKAENGMTLDGTVYKATVTLAAGDNTLKVTDGTWENTWGYGQLGAAYEEVFDAGEYNNIKITLAEEKEITVIFDATAGKITFDGLTENTASLTYTVKVPWGTETCYIATSATGWNFKAMNQNPDNNRLFSVDIVGAKETDEYKYALLADWDFAEVRENNRTEWAEQDNVTSWNKPTYTVAGDEALCGVDWKPDNYDNQMECKDNYETYVWHKGALYFTENVEFKVAKNSNWDVAYPENNVVLEIGEDKTNKPGYYTVTITYKRSNNNVTFELTPQEVQKATLSFDNAVLTEMEVEGTAGLEVNANSEDWLDAVQLFLKNYNGENKEYELSTESQVTYQEANTRYLSASGTVTKSVDANTGLIHFNGKINAIIEQYNNENNWFDATPYEFTLNLIEVAPLDVTIENATVSLNDATGYLTLTSTFTLDDVTYPTTVNLAAFESLVANKTYNNPQGGELQMGDDFVWLDFAITNSVDVSYNGNTIQLKGKFISFGGAIYNVTISGTIPSVQLDGGDNSTVISNNAGKLVMVEMDRTFATDDGYYTLCVPFDIMAYELGTVHTISSVTKAATEGFNVNFSEVETIKAGYPYLLEPSVNLTSPKFVVNLKNVAAQTSSASGQGLSISMNGVLTTTGTETTDGLYWVGNQGYLYNDDVAKLSLRSYFTITSASSVAPRMRVVTGENVETGVEDIIATDAPVKVIVNGQLIIIRDGVKYNVQGQKL